METDIKKVTMLMWEKKEMPKRIYDKENKIWKNTGELEEKTVYTFRDGYGSTLTLYAGNEYRELEGKLVNIHAEIEQREWQGKKTTRVKIREINQA